MAIKKLNNPCDDVQPESRTERRRQEQTTSNRSSRSRANRSEPDQVDESPNLDPRPFPQPFRQQDSDQDSAEPQNAREEAPNKRVISTATREITIIPNSLFLSPEANIASIKQLLSRNSSSKSQVNHGKVWFTGRPAEDLEEADLFRWSLHNFWASLGDREGIVNKASSGHENPFAKPNQDTRFNEEIAANTSEVIKLYRNQRLRKYALASGTGGVTLNVTPEPGIYTEDIRFCLYNDIKNQYLTPRGGSAPFLSAYAPSAFNNTSDGVVDNIKRKMNMFINMYLFGDSDASNWRSVERMDDWSTAAANFYRTGILKTDMLAIGNWRYKDFVFDAPVAFFEEELNGMLMAPFHSAKITKNVGNVDFVNLKGYENELEVPNVYYYYNSMELKKDYEEGTINNQSSHAERLAVLLAQGSILSKYQTNEKDEVFKTRDVLKFPSDRVVGLEKINEFMKGYAENYVEISINTTQGGHIGALLQRNNLDRILLETISPNKTRGSKLMSELSTSFDTKVAMVLDDSFKDSESEQNSIENTLNDRAVSNIPITVNDSFYDILKEKIPNAGTNELQKVDNFEYPLFYRGWNNVTILRLEETIRSQIFIKELEEFIANGKLQRSYADLLSGERAYSEVVGFKVEKYEMLEDGEENLVQTFLLMDSNDIETINFLDSQVMPYKKYRYKILSINIVLGTEYIYSPFVKVDTPFIDLKVHSKLGVYIIEAPFFEQVVEIRDMPPMFPQVSFLPTQGVDNAVKILLTTNYGEMKEPWYDPTASKETLKTKYGMDRQGLITFKTDSLPSAFEIYRLETPPESFLDFKNKNRKDFYFKVVPAISNAGISLENLVPNKYYYYMFRTLDNYDFDRKPGWTKKYLASNPTEIFRIRMVSYANGIFLDMDTYEIEKAKTKEQKIEFERLIKICPNFDQIAFNFSKVFDKLKKDVKIPQNSIDKVRKDQGIITHEQYIASSREFQRSAPSPKEMSLGTLKKQEDLVWSKRFKIRIKSKDSGKMIDFNVKFTQDQEDLTKEE